MNLRLLGYFRSYKAIRALIIYRYLYEIYKNYQETLYQAESSFFDLAAWDNQNTQKIEQGGDTTKQKTATGVENFSPENAPGLEHPESQNCIGFKAVFIYDLRPINLFYFRARYYDPIMGRFLSVDPMGYRDSMNLYQAFNMNPVNFVDPMGERIYLKGDDPLEAFGKILEFFKKIGISDIGKVLTWKEDEKGKYIAYINEDITLESKRLNGRTVYLEFPHPFGVQLWIRNNTQYLNKEPEIFAKSLEKLFDEIISSSTPIFFKLMESAEFREKYKDEGHGTCLDKDMSKSGEIEVIVEDFSKPKEVKALTRFYINIFQTIAHEFGHAYGLMKGYRYNKDEKPWDNIPSMNEEIAVLFENLYRVKSSSGDVRLRYSHDLPWKYYDQYWSNFRRWSENRGKTWFYYPEDENPYK